MSTAAQNSGVTPAARPIAIGRFGFAAHPVAGFVLLSAIFGITIIAVTPPLRGPDEAGHFLRAYGLARGDVVPSVRDNLGRKGIFLPAPFHRDFTLFDRWQSVGRGEGVPIWQVLDDFRQQPGTTESSEAESQPVFVPYAGSEGYSPAAYLPQAAAALLARAAGGGFLLTFYLMRVLGLAVMTATIAYAIALTPALKWPFVAIAMLPSALYGRAIINADAAAFAFGLVVVAMFLRAACGVSLVPPGRRSAWMVLCVLSKPPNLAFVLLEWLRPQRTPGWRKWRPVAIAMLPALAAAMLWTAASLADAGGWRMAELTGSAAQEFNPGWKLQFMFAHPFAFPAAVTGLFRKSDIGEFCRQLIGVLGLFDTVLRPGLYTAIGCFLIATFVTSCDCWARLFTALTAFITALAYGLAVILICYLSWTPVDADHVWGVQGRYFVPIVPLVAVMIAVFVRRGFDRNITCLLAIAAAVTSGIGSIEAILRTDWNF